MQRGRALERDFVALDALPHLPETFQKPQKEKIHTQDIVLMASTLGELHCKTHKGENELQ